MDEIERKFLIDRDKFFEYLKLNCTATEQNYIQIIQFYPHIDDEQEVRVRFIEDNRNSTDKIGFIFVKYFNNDNLLRRKEFVSIMDKYNTNEYYNYMIKSKSNYIIKHRYNILYKDHLLEIDIFRGDNEGLHIMEVELKDMNDNIELPGFIIKEITGDVKYYNKNLYINPYKNWRHG